MYASTRLLLLLDLSPSVSIVDPTTSKPLYANVFDSLSVLLRHLSSSPLLSSSTLYLSVVGHNPASCTPLFVLLQSAVLHPANVEAVLETVTQRAMEVENYQAEEQQHITHPSVPPPSNRPERPTEDVAEDDGSLVPSVWPDAGEDAGSFHLLLHQALFFLDRLPASAAPALVLLTDSVLPLSTALSSHDSVLALLLRRSIPLSLLQLTSASAAASFSFGYVPDTEIVRYATRVTGGLFAGQEGLQALLDRPERGWSALERNVFVRQGMLRGWDEREPPRGGLIGNVVRHRMRPATVSSSSAVSSPFALLLTIPAYLAPSPTAESDAPSPASLATLFAPTSPSVPLPFSPSDSWAYQYLLRERDRRYSMDVDVRAAAGVQTSRGLPRFRAPRGRTSAGAGEEGVEAGSVRRVAAGCAAQGGDAHRRRAGGRRRGEDQRDGTEARPQRRR